MLLLSSVSTFFSTLRGRPSASASAGGDPHTAHPQNNDDEDDDSDDNDDAAALFQIKSRFERKIQKYLHDGASGLQLKDKMQYLPYDDLKRCWQKSEISRVLKLVKIQESARKVYDKYLRVFSTLVVIGKTRYLKNFLDHGIEDMSCLRFPVPERWPDSCHLDFLDEFQDKKWMFFPFEFDKHCLYGGENVLDERRILPMEVSEIKSSIGSANHVKIYKAKILASHNNFTTPADGSKKTGPKQQHTFALKACPINCDDYEEFQNELEEFRRRYNCGPCDNIIQYYGCFEHHLVSYMILDFADGGSFLEYLQEHPPQTESDSQDFWESASGIFKAVRTIHQAGFGAHNTIRPVVHQDLKLDNFVLVRSSSSASRYKFTVKLIDFGHSSVAVAKRGERDPHPEWTAIDRRGNAIFSAPEVSHHRTDLENGPDEITPAADVWALGCIILILAAWMCGGKVNVDNFDRLRQNALRHNGNFKGSGYTQCFHDGVDLLEAVREECNRFKKQLMIRGDMITTLMIDEALKHMLRGDPKEREKAKPLLQRIQKILEGSRPSSPEPMPARGLDATVRAMASYNLGGSNAAGLPGGWPSDNEESATYKEPSGDAGNGWNDCVASNEGTESCVNSNITYAHPRDDWAIYTFFYIFSISVYSFLYLICFISSQLIVCILLLYLWNHGNNIPKANRSKDWIIYVFIYIFTVFVYSLLYLVHFISSHLMVTCILILYFTFSYSPFNLLAWMATPVQAGFPPQKRP